MSMFWDNLIALRSSVARSPTFPPPSLILLADVPHPPHRSVYS
jgi:hypothetical protein